MQSTYFYVDCIFSLVYWWEMAPRKKPTKKQSPNLALKQVRVATGLSQSRFAQLVGVSAAYIQAVELGQRKASAELADSVSAQTGVSPTCIAEGWSQAFDLDGKPYSAESYKQFTGEGSKPTPHEEIERLLNSANVVLVAARKVGKSALVANVLRSKLREFAQQVIVIDSVDGALRNVLGSTGQVTVGQLRADKELARRVTYVDDASLPDKAAVVLYLEQGKPEEIVNRLFPQSESAPDWDRLRQRYGTNVA